MVSPEFLWLLLLADETMNRCNENSAVLLYAPSDFDTAISLRHWLSARNIRIWMDHVDLLPGQCSEHATANAIARSSHLLVLVSRQGGLPQRILSMGRLAPQDKKTVVLLLTDGASIPKRFRRSACVDYSRVRRRSAVDELAVMIGSTRPLPHFLSNEYDPRWHTRYTVFHLPRDVRPDTFILANPALYSSIGDLLEDLRTFYLKDVILPETYGKRWVLIGDPSYTHVAVPFAWIYMAGRSVSEVSPEWLRDTHPFDLNLRPKTHWFVAIDQNQSPHAADMTITLDRIKSRLCGVLANSPELAEVLFCSRAAFRGCAFEDFELRQPGATQVNKFRYRFVFHDQSFPGFADHIYVQKRRPISKERMAWFRYIRDGFLGQQVRMPGIGMGEL